MKRLAAIFFGILLLINSACKNEKKSPVKTTQKNNKKNIIFIKRQERLLPIDDIKNEVEKNTAFVKLIESFDADTYSLDELIDHTQKNLKLFQQLKVRRFKSKIDTAAVKSRLILAEVNTKKLDFLLHKHKPEKDTIAKTFNAIVRSLNSAIQQMKIYNRSYDEFEEILTRDSLLSAQKDSLPVKMPFEKDIPEPVKRLKRRQTVKPLSLKKKI